VPDTGFASPESLRRQALAALSDFAGGSRGEIEAAAPLLRAARASAQAGEPGRGVVAELAARWDERALTAAEFAEQLPAAELSALLGGAPAWARAFGTGWRAAA